MKIVRRWVQLWLVVPLFYNCVVFNGGGFWFLVINYVFFNKKGGEYVFGIIVPGSEGPSTALWLAVLNFL